MKLKNNITLLLLVTTISCCHDFLGERPLSSVTDGISFETEHMLEANMRGIYNSLSYMTSSTWLGYLGYASRLEVWRGSTRTDFEHEQCHELCLGAKSSANESIYLSIYSSINMCNTLIDGLKDSPVNESYKEEIYGEALFMRAFFYFQLVRLYGNVPLILNQCRNTGDANVARTRYDIVYKAILDDLDKAFKMMRSQSRQLEVNPGADRPINMAAKVLMAQVYTQIGSILDSPEDQAFGTILDGPLTPDFTCCGIAIAGEAWTEALKLEEEVIKSDVYALEPDYRNLFRWDSRNHPTDFSSKERILTLSNTIESGTVHMSSWTVWDYPDGIWSKRLFFFWFLQHIMCRKAYISLVCCSVNFYKLNTSM